MIGQNIAHYTIIEKIGEGGMGEVYRATDTKLNRDVALKVLPEAFAHDPHRMGRFQREAEVLASLNHPNIAGIHGLEQEGSTHAIAMELVEGETLAVRIKKGAIPLEEALKIALQIAEALEAAHEKGIIHRDLKPANVIFTSEGTAKVLDFGLAKAMEPATSSDADLSQSPTLTMQATQAGIILGTAAYMSPEQARGEAADNRPDVWSLGVVLFEMLSGAQVFDAGTVSDVLAHVLAREPEWSKLPSDCPNVIRRLIQRCLSKDRSRRLAAASEVIVTIEDYLDDPAAGEIQQQPAAVATRTVLQQSRHWGTTALFAVAFLALLWRPWQQPPEPPQPTRMTLQIPVALSSVRGASVVLSPDERLIVSATSEPALHFRRIDQSEGARLSGTGRARSPFFSPDGKWIAFATNSALKKVSINGGAPLELCEVNNFRGGTWGEDGTIVFSPGRGQPLYRVSDAGGVTEAITALEEGERSHRWPDFLPGAKAVLMTVQTSTSFEDARIEVVTLSDGQRKVIYQGGYSARYVPTGHLVFLHEGTLFGAPFDPDRLELLGQPAPVLEDVMGNFDNRGNGQFAFSRQGSLIYQTGTVTQSGRSLVWVDREGSITPWETEAAAYRAPRFSPDGRRLATTINDGTQGDIWIQDLVRGTRSRLTFDDAFFPVWNPDGTEILFSSARSGQANIYRKRSDGTGEAERLTESENGPFATSISADGRYLAFFTGGAEDLWTLTLEEGAKPELFLQSEFSESQGAFSPDGRWMAYLSNESGRSEIYVRPFPKGSGKWQISTQGGVHPIWSSTGDELFYFWQDTMYVVSYQAEAEAFRVQSPEPLFSGTFEAMGFNRGYDLGPDGKRFVMLQQEARAESEPSKVILIQNWFEELKRKVPTDN